MHTRRFSIPRLAASVCLLLWMLLGAIAAPGFAQTANPHAYASRPLGFEVNLPPDWVVNEYSNVGFGFAFMSPGLQFDENGDLQKGALITVQVSETDADPSALTPRQSKAEGQAVRVGQQPGLRYPARGGAKDAETVVDVYRPGLLYRFTLHYNRSGAERKTYEEAFASLLDSLAFTAREGQLPEKSADVSASAVESLYPALAFPFQSGSDWKIPDAGGYDSYTSGGDHGAPGWGYSKYALDFIRRDGRTDVLALAPTSGVLSHKETTASKCIDVSIEGISSTRDLYLQICHLDFDSYLNDGSSLSKGQRLGPLSLDRCGEKCSLPHIHIAAFTGVRGNPWSDAPSMTAVQFDTEHALALDGVSFTSNGSPNQWGNTCCYRSSLPAPGPILSTELVVRDPKNDGAIYFKPLHPQRTLYVQILNSSNQVAYSGQTTAQYQANGDYFTGLVQLPANWSTGSYLVKLQLDHTLRVQVPGILTIASGSYVALPRVSLRAGDANGDNTLSILDYNMILDCYSELLPPRSCSDPNKKLGADVNDDGAVNALDYNLWIRILSVEMGE